MNARIALLGCLGLAACSDAKPTPPAERTPTKRTIPPPPRGTVQPLPPHAIRTDGFGPYRLGDAINSLLVMQPDGARMVRFDLPGVVRTGLLRFEDDELLVGGEPGSVATFLAVMSGDVARTETGVHVGSELPELIKALGPRVDEPYVARDPRLAVMAQLRRVRAILDGERIMAFVLAPEPTAPRPAADECVRPRAPASIAAVGACLTPAGELVSVTGDEVLIRSADGDRTLAAVRTPGLVFALPLRAVEDHRDDLVVVTRTADTEVRREWSVVAYRFDAGTGKLVRVAEAVPVYTLTSAQTRFISAGLRDVDLYLEVAAQAGAIEISGVLTTETAGRVRDVGMIAPVVITRGHSGKSTAPPPVTGNASAPANAPANAPSGPSDAPADAPLAPEAADAASGPAPDGGA